MKKKLCLDCDKPINGRIDKKFCSDYCRSAYHYNKNLQKNAGLYKKIDTQLKLNRRLLRNFNKAGKATIRKEVLLKAGFDPGYFTHYWKAQNGNVYLFCYEYGFLEITEHDRLKYRLVHWQDYMDK